MGKNRTQVLSLCFIPSYKDKKRSKAWRDTPIAKRTSLVNNPSPPFSSLIHPLRVPFHGPFPHFLSRFPALCVSLGLNFLGSMRGLLSMSDSKQATDIGLNARPSVGVTKHIAAFACYNAPHGRTPSNHC